MPQEPISLTLKKLGSGGQDLPDLVVPERQKAEPVDVAPAKQDKYTSKGFIENVGKGLWNVARGIHGIISYAGDVGWRGGSELVDYLKGEPNTATELAYTKEGAGVIYEGISKGAVEVAKNIVDSYKRYENPWDKLYNEPIDVTTDVLTVLSLGGLGFLKSAQVARHAGAPAKAVTALEKTGQFFHKFPFGKVMGPEGTYVKALKPIAESPVVKAISKVPGVVPLLRGLKLTPETNAAWRLFNKYVINYRAQSTEKDLAEIMRLANNIPERDAARNILRAAMTGDPSRLKNPASLKVYELLKKFNKEQLLEKVEFGRLTREQAENSAKVPMQNLLARINLRKARLKGEISRSTEKMLVELLNAPALNAGLKNKVKILAAIGVIPKKAARLIQNTGKASKYVRHAYAPLDDVLVKTRVADVIDPNVAKQTDAAINAMLNSDPTLVKARKRLIDIDKNIDRINKVGPQTGHAGAQLNRALFIMEEAKKHLENLINERTQAIKFAQGDVFNALGTPIFRTDVARVGLKTFLKGKDPVYFPLMHQNNLNVWDAFTTQPLRQNRQSWMYARTGASGYISDVRTVLTLMRIQYRQWQSLERFFHSLKSQPFVRDVTDEVRTKGSAYMPKAGNMIFSPDHSLLPFYKDMNAMGEAFARKIKDQADELGGDAFRKAIKETLSLDIQEIVRRSAVSRGNIRIYEIPIEVGEMLRRAVRPPSKWIKYLFETPADLLRLTALTFNPVWYIGNLIGNLMFQVMSGVGLSAYFRGSKATFKRIVPKDLLDEVSFALTSSLHEAERKGGYRAGKFFTNAPVARSFMAFNEKVENWSRRVTFVDALTKEAYKRKMLTAAEAMFGSDELIAKRIAPLMEEARVRGRNVNDVILGLKDGSGVSEAINFTNKWMFDYNNLHPIDRYVMRRMVPFWTFVKNVNLLMLRLPFERPALFKVLTHATPVLEQRMHQMLLDAINDDDLPDYLEGHLPIGRTEDGSFIFLSLRGLNPFSAFGSVEPLNPLRSLASMSNPIIKATVEHIGGRDVWSKRDLLHDEPMWDWGGRKYAIRKVGDQTVAQAAAPGPVGVKGFFTTFANQYPWTKAWRAIMAAQTVDANGEPVRLPVIDEAGNSIYPTPILYSAIKMTGVNLKDFSPEEYTRRKHRARRKFIQSVVSQMRRAPPNLREFYMEALKDAQAGNFDVRND